MAELEEEEEQLVPVIEEEERAEVIQSDPWMNYKFVDRKYLFRITSLVDDHYNQPIIAVDDDHQIDLCLVIRRKDWYCTKSAEGESARIDCVKKSTDQFQKSISILNRSNPFDELNRIFVELLGFDFDWPYLHFVYLFMHLACSNHDLNSNNKLYLDVVLKVFTAHCHYKGGGEEEEHRQLPETLIDFPEICGLCAKEFSFPGGNDDITGLDCGHVFHADCIKSFNEGKDDITCPLCGFTFNFWI